MFEEKNSFIHCRKVQYVNMLRNRFSGFSSKNKKRKTIFMMIQKVKQHAFSAFLFCLLNCEP